MEKEELRIRGMMEQLRNEVSIHTELKHPHILRVIDRCETPSHYYLVLELATRTLQHWTQGFPQQRVPEKQVLGPMVQVVSAVLYLHENGYMHRDLTLSNMLFAPGEREESVVKVADFGWACRAENIPQAPCGSMEIWAPEILCVAVQVNNQLGVPPQLYKVETTIGIEVDAWAIGIAIYTLLCGVVPFPVPPPCPPSAIPSAFTCMVCMFVYHPPQGVRISDRMNTVLTHLLTRKKQRLTMVKLLEYLEEPKASPRVMASEQSSSASSPLVSGPGVLGQEKLAQMR
jgi:serine/threonine protein kinase